MKALSLTWHFAIADLKITYRMSSLGPLWQTLTLAGQLTVIIVVFTRLFDTDPTGYAVHVSVGFLVWGLLVGTLSAAPASLVASRELIHQTSLPFEVYTFRPVLSNLFAFGHNLLVLIPVFILFPVTLNFSQLLSILGVIFLGVSLFSISKILAIIGARVRDLELVWRGALTLAFYATPILWSPDQITSPGILALINANPLFHLIEVVRSPIAGNGASSTSFIFVGLLAVSSTALAFFLGKHAKPRIPFWV
jgi:ABC-type polysaccharide/polyol phosphate export permease